MPDPHEHAPAGLLPADWEVVLAPADGIALVARAPADPEAPAAFRANLVLTEVPTGELSFRDWQAGTDELLPRVLEDYLLVDLERGEIAGRVAGRRLAHHRGPGGEALTMEQWFVLVEDVGHTLTATAPTAAYDGLADLFAAVAARWRPAAARTVSQTGSPSVSQAPSQEGAAVDAP